jgi:glycosyltransferase involved in cell wall biosynthesis
MKPCERLVVINTHPVQYHAPVYREVQRLGLDVTAVYGSDAGVSGYVDREFGVQLNWDADLLGGYSHIFLAHEQGIEKKGPYGVRADGLSAVLKKLQPTAILLTGYGTRFHKDAIVASLATGVPLLFRAETTDHAVRRTIIRSLLRDTALRLLYARCSALLYIGSRSRAHYERLGVSSSKLWFAPYCVDTTPFATGEEARAILRDEVRRELGIAPSRRVFIFAGKLVHRKGPDLLLDAIHSLPAHEARSAEVVFLGDGEMREALLTRARGIPTHFVGFQQQSRLSRYYHAADVMVLPSRRSETWGLVVNEALHHGLPAIVSDNVGSSQDLVVARSTGEVFAANSATSLRDAIKRWASWDDASEAQRQTRRERAAAYSINAAARGILRGYQTLDAGGYQSHQPAGNDTADSSRE